MPTEGYRGGNTRPHRSFMTGLLGSDSTGNNLTSKANEVKQRGKLGKREKYDGRGGRW